MKHDLKKALEVLRRTSDSLELDIAYGRGNPDKRNLVEAIDTVTSFIVDILTFFRDENRKLKVCRMCDNARLNDELTDENDYSAVAVGNCTDGYRMMLCSGWGKPLRIEVEKWHDRAGWYKIGVYEPKYCPNCGRKIVEYDKERRQNDDRKQSVKKMADND